MKSSELIAFNLISNAGEASANFLKAIQHAENGNFEEANKCIEMGEKAALEVHKQQTALIQSEAAGEKYEINILLIHAQDHLMNSMLLKDLAKSIIRLNKKLADNNLL